MSGFAQYRVKESKELFLISLLAKYLKEKVVVKGVILSISFHALLRHGDELYFEILEKKKIFFLEE